MAYNQPSRQQSPWFYLGIGCAALVAISMVGCIALGITAVNKFKEIGKQVAEDAKKPVTKQELVKAFQDVPFYPNATVNTDTEFRTLRATVRLMRGTHLFKDVEVAMLTTADPADQVISYYRKKLTAAGYSETKSSIKEKNSGEQVQLEFRKGHDEVMVQIHHPVSDSANQNAVVTLMRFEGIQEGFRYQAPTKAP